MRPRDKKRRAGTSRRLPTFRSVPAEGRPAAGSCTACRGLTELASISAELYILQRFSPSPNSPFPLPPFVPRIRHLPVTVLSPRPRRSVDGEAPLVSPALAVAQLPGDGPGQGLLQAARESLLAGAAESGE